MIFNLQSSIHDLQSTIYNPRSTIHDLQSTIYKPRSTNHDLQSTISYLDYNGARAFLPVSFFKSSLQSSIPNPQSSIINLFRIPWRPWRLGGQSSCAETAGEIPVGAGEFPCAIAAGPIDGDCLTTLCSGGGRSLDFRAAFVPYYTARCIIRTIAARGIIKLLAEENESYCTNSFCDNSSRSFCYRLQTLE